MPPLPYSEISQSALVFTASNWFRSALCPKLLWRVSQGRGQFPQSCLVVMGLAYITHIDISCLPRNCSKGSLGV